MSTQQLCSTERKARKRFTCQLCRKLIEIGTVYLDERYADGSQAWTHRCHVRCATVYNANAWYYGVDDEDCADLNELTEGHEIACPLAVQPHVKGICSCAAVDGSNPEGRLLSPE